MGKHSGQPTNPSIIFTTDQFTPTQWNTSEDKAAFANAFVRFVESGFSAAEFPTWFYRRLSQTFGHIAHYNLHEFYQTFFTCPADKLGFLHQTVEHVPVGDPAWTYSDVEWAIRDWLIGTGAMKIPEWRAHDAQNRAEQDQLRRLLNRHRLPKE